MAEHESLPVTVFLTSMEMVQTLPCGSLLWNINTA